MCLLGYRAGPCVFSVKHENRPFSEEPDVIVMVKIGTVRIIWKRKQQQERHRANIHVFD